ncbi:MAG: hypothetical protein HY875_04600 [Chloroflexi bacterium]|nr:hypothetical protein [Chloroflexota bacterium]
MGYDRYASREAHAILGRLYPLVCAQLNFFRPVRKLVAKDRTGARVLKHYDVPRTAYHRLLESGVLSPEERAGLQGLKASLNPAELQRRIDQLERKLWRLDREDASLAADVG